MRLATFAYRNTVRIGVVDNNTLLSPDPAAGTPATMLELIAGGESALARFFTAAQVAQPLPVDHVRLLAPIPQPARNIMCLGFNYVEHVQETAGSTVDARAIPEHPVVFTKNTTSVVGPGAQVPCHPDITSELDWEVELAVVIGSGGRAIREPDALDHVFGYTVINDLSARDLQVRHQQFFLGKSLDGSCPMGPWLVTRDEISDPQNLNLRCRVNGEIKQNSNTQHMVFDVATIIARLSRGMTLQPGDIIATGTPSGVGFTREPPEFLRPGDTVACEIDGIGTLVNSLVAG